jgi:hypothetical protein
LPPDFVILPLNVCESIEPLIDEDEALEDGLDWLADEGLLGSCAADWLELVAVLWGELLLAAELCDGEAASVLCAKTGSATRATANTPSTRDSLKRLIFLNLQTDKHSVAGSVSARVVPTAQPT